MGRSLGLLGLSLAAALAGCNGHPVDRLDNVVTAVNRQENRLPAKTKLDFLFVVDNSGSMCQEQRNLTANFRAFSEFLFQELGAAADYRIAVTSTDMQTAGQKGAFLNTPAEPVASLNCKDENDQPLIPDTADCPANLPLIIQSDQVDTQADLEKAFRCLATLGTGGDGFEKGLEAMRLALSCHGPNRGLFSQCCNEDGTYNPACVIPPETPEPVFLRPDAVLVVIFITDENDCSDPATNPTDSRRVICKYGSGDGDGDGVPDGYRDGELCGGRSPAECFRAECGDLDAEACRVERCIISRAANSNCEWFRGNLTPVEDYYRFLTGLKAQPLESIVVAAVVGLRAFTDQGNEVTYNPGTPENPGCNPDDPAFNPALKDTEACCPNGACRGEIQTSCESANGEAFSGRRYLQLTELFAEDGNGIGCPAGADPNDPTECVHICVNDFAGPLGRIKEQVSKLIGTYCLDKPPACMVPAAGDVPAHACATAEELANLGNYSVRVRMECQLSIEQGGKCEEIIPPRVLPADQWSLELGQSGCAGGAVVRLNNPPPAGADVFVEFLVALDGQSNAGGTDAGVPPAEAPPTDAPAGP
ncbi:MAG: hypothetical protein KC549_17895 [Myxococcales bacterium]|nr:hypothetical protein [Myxococcales bacterium]MCB9547950.1 hypothetical protein [Myxococcales bacterium]